jgi:hypothetical protein
MWTTHSHLYHPARGKVSGEYASALHDMCTSESCARTLSGDEFDVLHRITPGRIVCRRLPVDHDASAAAQTHARKGRISVMSYDGVRAGELTR